MPPVAPAYAQLLKLHLNGLRYFMPCSAQTAPSPRVNETYDPDCSIIRRWRVMPASITFHANGGMNVHTTAAMTLR